MSSANGTIVNPSILGYNDVSKQATEGGFPLLFLDNGNIHDPTLNLALEEYALRSLPDEDDYLLFYINEPSIIIGKNQNTAEEVNETYVRDRGIHVVRRLSGGGAVYHDLGNLSFSFITRDDGKSFHNFRKFTEPVVAALRKLGVEAELTGRNDLQVGERKISGNAQFSSKGRMFSHGTLLFDSEVDSIVSALNVNPVKFESKATKSVRSRVANISEFLREPMQMEQFKQAMLDSIFDGADIPKYTLTEADWDAVRRLADERYRNWDWNYGRSPAFNVRQVKRLAAGTYDVRLNVIEGVIREAAVYGDFFGTGEVSEVTDCLYGIRYDKEAIAGALSGVDLTVYFGPVGREEWLALLI
ncbi:MAG: lipoate--protein ligase [Cohnella sp.]|nr:lipoate--protein ligase [Cohnella sp.]